MTIPVSGKTPTGKTPPVSKRKRRAPTRPCEDGRFCLDTREGIEKAYNDLAEAVATDQIDFQKARLLKDIFSGAKAALDAKQKREPQEHTNDATAGVDEGQLKARGPFAVVIGGKG